ncbi:hypothetical protein P775_15655 [Puniceibacterium antarcticum]|uniref:Uncharacterized protein n=1 Tax=Puniceibacterium antarcticum TaxID=1206336 RepID=A0A2G8RCS3_9RHOB|nr:hypothetical protein P775_15655 [Puniceibacterium antarcticum]
MNLEGCKAHADGNDPRQHLYGQVVIRQFLGRMCLCLMSDGRKGQSKRSADESPSMHAKLPHLLFQFRHSLENRLPSGVIQGQIRDESTSQPVGNAGAFLLAEHAIVVLKA